MQMMQKKKILFSSLLVLTILILSGCSNGTKDKTSSSSVTPLNADKVNTILEKSNNNDDHHAGEENIKPHDDSIGDSHDDAGQPPHRH